MTPAKPVVVGSFALGALVIGVVGILALGGQHLFKTSIRVVVIFRDSVAGLEVGAPVTFRGVRIGRVESMRVHIDPHAHRDWIPIYLDLDPDRVTWVNGSAATDRAELQSAVNSGLRAQLVAQSLVTGQLTVNLDLHPDTRAIFDAPTDEAFEIPTVPSDLQNLKDQLLQLDLPDLGQKTRETLLATQKVLETVQIAIGPLAASLQTTLDSTTEAVRTVQADTARTLADIDRLAAETRQQIATNGNDLDRLLQSAEGATTRADALLASLNDMTSAHSALRGDLQASVRDLAASASSLRSLLHDLERNPAGTLLRKERQ
jgi:paraquat-inducible protein B